MSGNWRVDQVWEEKRPDEHRAVHIQVGLARKGEEPPDAVAVMFTFEDDTGSSKYVTAILNRDEAAAFSEAVTLMTHEIDL